MNKDLDTDVKSIELLYDVWLRFGLFLHYYPLLLDNLSLKSECSHAP